MSELNISPKVNLMLGDKGSRRKHDFYPTPPEVTVALMDFLGIPPCVVWECACGEGAMTDVLKKYGHSVIATDIKNGEDYLKEKRTADAIITNPPFNISHLFIKKAVQEANIVAFVLKSQYWHAAGRFELFWRWPPTFVLPLTWRPDFSGHGGSIMEVLWTVWIRGRNDTRYKPLEKPAADHPMLVSGTRQRTLFDNDQTISKIA